MKSRLFALALAIGVLPRLAVAMPWHGITPGVSTKTDVVKQFGEPSKKVSSGAQEILAYTAEQAIKGSSQAQFEINAQGIVEKITVFPAVSIDKGTVEESYGPACGAEPKGPPVPCYSKQLTDEFRTYFWYRSRGFVVFFTEDNKTVFSLVYTAPSVRK